MNKADCFNLGHIAKLHGFKGEVSLFFDTTHPEDYSDISTVFIELDGNLIPHFIENIQLNNKGFAKVKFEDVSTESEARALLGKQIFLPLEVLPQLGDRNFYDYEVVNFEVIDENFGVVGKLIEVIDFSSNPLLQIEAEGEKEVLVPLHSGVIQKVDRKNKQLHISAPEGLIEMYLED